MSTTPPFGQLTGVILAGGRASRMHGVDKGLIEIDGEPMVTHILRRLQPQCAALLVNANRNIERYAALCGCPVLEDTVDGFAGPLAGMAAAMNSARTPFILTVPCDSPLIAPDLAARLLEGLGSAEADISVAHDGVRLQPVFALLRTQLASSLVEYLGAGQRKIDAWYALHRYVECDFSDRAETFLNINTPAERDRLETALRRSRC